MLDTKEIKEASELDGKTVLKIITTQMDFMTASSFISHYRDTINLEDFLIQAKKEEWTLSMLYALCKTDDEFYNSALLLKLGTLFNCY